MRFFAFLLVFLSLAPASHAQYKPMYIYTQFEMEEDGKKSNTYYPTAFNCTKEYCNVITLELNRCSPPKNTIKKDVYSTLKNGGLTVEDLQDNTYKFELRSGAKYILKFKCNNKHGKEFCDEAIESTGTTSNSKVKLTKSTPEDMTAVCRK